MSKNPTDLYNVMSFISLFRLLHFALRLARKKKNKKQKTQQIKTVVTSSDTQITSHFSSHFVSYSTAVDALCAIKKSFRKMISECL